MSIQDEIAAQTTAAMKARDSARVAALRNVRAAFTTEMKKDGADSLSDEACVAVLRKLSKQRKESIEAFENAGRSDRADAERTELAVLEEFLPQLADEATTRQWVDDAIAASGATGPKDLGKVMGALMKAHKADIDGNLARRLASERLQSAD
ncbi:MAG: GatB/YqeY domain-containing protein [Proteobacteria bacterium]|nr:GatB/YqeY domain-containing protein [Pseudomonadota bacterium]